MISQTEIQARNYWDKTWTRFLKFHGMIAPSAKLVQHLFNYVARNGIILDLGCGEGRNSLYLSRVGYNVVGLDLSFKATKVMKNNFFEESLKGQVLTGDARNLPIRSDSVDGILAHHVFDFLDKAGLTIAFDEAFRVLKPGGVLLFTMDSFADAKNDSSVVNKDDGSMVYTKGPGKGMLIRPFDQGELKGFVDRGWEFIKDDLTPSQSKISLLKKIKATN
jgi:SAM-dependent methyltransferase